MKGPFVVTATLLMYVHTNRSCMHMLLRSINQFRLILFSLLIIPTHQFSRIFGIWPGWVPHITAPTVPRTNEHTDSRTRTAVELVDTKSHDFCCASRPQTPSFYNALLTTTRVTSTHNINRQHLTTPGILDNCCCLARFLSEGAS